MYDYEFSATISTKFHIMDIELVETTGFYFIEILKFKTTFLRLFQNKEPDQFVLSQVVLNLLNLLESGGKGAPLPISVYPKTELIIYHICI